MPTTAADATDEHEGQRPAAKRRRRQRAGEGDEEDGEGEGQSQGGGEGTAGRNGKRRRPGNGDGGGSGHGGESDDGFVPGMWSLEELVMALLGGCLSAHEAHGADAGAPDGDSGSTGGADGADGGSYLALDAAKHWPRYVEILEQSGVVERHPADSNRIRMVMFAG